MTKVRISELKSHLAKHLRAAEAGETIEVFDRARPIARLVPVGTDDDDRLEITAAARTFREVRRVKLPPLPSTSMGSAEALRRERGHR